MNYEQKKVRYWQRSSVCAADLMTGNVANINQLECG